MGLVLSPVVPAATFAQLSPGELTSAHAGLEGIGNCTSCHAIGKVIANDKCLACHQELDRRIQAKKGYHATLSGHDCVECHKEHHGRSFSIVRFKQSDYDHTKNSGFLLDGKHSQLQCASCHKPQFITAADVRSNAALMKGTTYLGLSPSCMGCHEDVHRGQFDPNCRKCHTTEKWKPVSGFSHDNARFRLTGAHITVPCARCHKASIVDPRAAVFKGLAFNRCVDCHEDPHQGRLKGDCSSCHTTAGWKQAESKFNHAATTFPLRGMHLRLRCEGCHVAGTGRIALRTLRFPRSERCADCHKDPHAGQFTTGKANPNCERCHIEDGWKEGFVKRFEHSSTRFPLKGKHRLARCMDCHGKAGQTHLVATTLKGDQRCGDCHIDPHGGQFKNASHPRDCGECHAEEGFVPTTYTAAMHNATRMSLDGGHEAVPCNRCHMRISESGRSVQQFTRPAAPLCVDCHKDPHSGQLDGWKPLCVACHTSRSWTDVRFRHDQTQFRLEGRHRDLRCASCHGAKDNTRAVAEWQFRGIPVKCEGCHGTGKPTGGGNQRQ